MSDDLIEGLNKKQKEAVLLEKNKNALILAGAGSGKTRVLTHRIVYLINNNPINITNILALTFTNKAAGEMRERLSILLRTPINQSSWVGTFHSLAYKLLRLHFAEAKLNKDFQIIDGSDQNRIIKRIIKGLNIDDKKFPAKQFISFINSSKDNGLRFTDIDAGNNFFIKKSIEVFKVYEEHCQKENLIDFAEILIRCFEMLKTNNSILQKYQTQFHHILVDEFQDTNSVQYNIIKLLKNDKNVIFCVGDDDQSIYGWRGAKIENIRNLANDFIPLEVIKLEQNYRSTGNILKASNQLIANNSGRMNKSLWTDDGDGELIDIVEKKDEKQEANFIAKQILQNKENNIEFKQNAILYRSNALSRAIEESFIRNKINYIIYGGLRFFDRSEVKDGLHYLRLVTNYNDNIAFERIVNFPTRGIGNATLELIKQFAIQNQLSYFEASKKILTTLSTRASNALGGFIAIIENLNLEITNSSLGEKLELILQKSGLIAHYQNDKTDKTGAKTQNLKELIGAAKDFNNEDEDIDDTSAFISNTLLDSGEKQNTNSVQLMTIHSAKGLEFENVFLIGMEEDLFPTRQSKDEPHLILEERRLCYVAMTRAKKKLTISFVRARFLYGNFSASPVSRFIAEIPLQHINKVHNDNKYEDYEGYTDKVKAKISTIKTKDNEYSINRRVVHKKFGLGRVKNYEGGDNARVEVDFDKHGKKWLILEYAKLEKL